jgi:acyl-CoA synthetase (AMP-forming)/AMP-acid ligase II
MAETTFAVTQVAPTLAPPVLAVDRNHCVSSGTLVPGTEVRIVDPSGVDLADGDVGEIAIKSATMFDGYRNYPEKTAAVLRDDWYYSGDLGFCLEGHLYVIGRKKDVIIVAGNNIYPEDVETAVAAASGVIPASGKPSRQANKDRAAALNLAPEIQN